MGTRVLRFIPNTPALVAWGQKPRTSHLSDWINSQTEGNILNSHKRCIAHMKQVFIIQDHTSKFTQILHPWNIRPLNGHPSGHPHNKFRGAMLLALRRPFLISFTVSSLAHCTFTRAKARRAPSMQTDRLTTSSRGQASTSHLTRPK